MSGQQREKRLWLVATFPTTTAAITMELYILFLHLLLLLFCLMFFQSLVLLLDMLYVFRLLV